MSDNKKAANTHRQFRDHKRQTVKPLRRQNSLPKKADSKPLAIFGGTATGKTHLLYAVKNKIEQNTPELHVILTTAVDMASALANTISNGGTAEQFREQYGIMVMSFRLTYSGLLVGS